MWPGVGYFLARFSSHMGVSQVTLMVCVIGFTAAAAAYDLTTKKIPNALTVTAFIAAVLFHTLSGAFQSGIAGAGHGVLMSLGGFATGFGILFVLWVIGAGGGGDVKLMGALGSWLGATTTLQVFLLSSLFVLIGSVVVVASSACSKGLFRTKEKYLSANGTAVEAVDKQRVNRRLMPYGVPVALATWSLLAHSGLKNFGLDW